MSKFGEIISNYFYKLQALNFSGEIALLFLSERFREKFSKEYLEEKKEESEDGIEKFSLSAKEYNDFEKLTSGFGYLPRSLIVTAISVYDVLISKLIEEYFNIKTDAIKMIKQDITYEELATFQNLEEARKHLVWREIDLLLRNSHAEHLKWIEDKLKISGIINNNNKWLKDFLEITERRNLFVHNDGIVNKFYLKNCIDNGINTGKLKEMDVLDCDEKYYNKAFNTLYEFGILLGQTVWRKVLPEEIKEANESLFDIIVQMISDGRYSGSLAILEYYKKSWIKQFDPEDQLVLDINIAQSHKWKGDDKSCQKVLAERNWMAYSNRYKLAYYILKDDFINAIQIIKIIDETDNIGITSIREWPLFKNAIKNDEFKAACKSKYNEDI